MKMKTLYKFLLSFLCACLATGCNFFSDIEETVSGKNYDSEVTAVVFGSTSLNVTTTESEYLKLALTPSANQAKCTVDWEYNPDFIDAETDRFGAVITGKKAGSTYIKARCNGIVATCMLSVIDTGDKPGTDPYIYSDASVVQLQPNDSTTVTASLYGGSIADMERFEWEIKDPSVAEIAFSRNNCVITAMKPGSTQLVCRHPNAAYEYSFVVYVYTDRLTETYITTDYNVLTVNKNDVSSKLLYVDLVNPVSAAYENGFTWAFADEESKKIISLSANRDSAEIIPLCNGVANIIVSHENSRYDLSIVVRVATVVKNVFIGVTETTALIQGSDTPYTVYANLENYDNYVNPDSFKWSVPEEAASLAECTAAGNSMMILGKKNGTFKINVSHELSEFSRNILVILQNQIGSAIDASMYITTDQNYIQTQVGRDPTTVNVRLVGGIDGEDNIGDETTNFTWYIKDGRNNGIVEIQQTTGSVADLNARSAATSGESCDAKLVINPIAAGELTVVVTHPRCLYDTEITVRVFAESALVNPMTVTTEDSLIRLLNGTSKEVTAVLRNHKDGDENGIMWESADPSCISVSPVTGATTQISACGSGSHQTYVTASHTGAISARKILVLSADTQEELASMKGIYADSTYLRISAKETKTVSVESFGLSFSDRVSWTSSDSSVCTVNADSASNYGSSAAVEGISAGKAEITASVSGAEPVVFDVTVLAEGESSEIYDETAGYMTTNLNAVVLESTDDTASLSVTGVNISESDMQSCTNWTMNDFEPVAGDPVFDLFANGSTAQLTANRPGKSNIRITNKYSQNSLTVNAKCGELYEWTDDYIVYITAENDVVNILNGGSAHITCSLVNTTSAGQFGWQVTRGTENIEALGTTAGYCTITGKQAGQAIITVTNSLAGEITKDILVNVANTEEELKGFKYLTTAQNVVTVGEQSNVSVSVGIKNADSNILSGYSWRSTDTAVADVVGSGNIAVIYGKKTGTSKIIVENYENCSYPLEIIVNVVDPVAAAADPYISCKNIATCTVGGDSATVVAELVGGSGGDLTGFSWNIVDSSVATLYASNDSAQIKAVSEGVTQVIVSHPKAAVSRSILVICEPKTTVNCYIMLTESIIKMSPSDSARTITATLVNGDADDVYDFKWWADSYDRINMNYTGESCIIEPVGSGTVTLHCSHPKAASVKDIVLYIGNYSDFAFASDHIEIVTGTDTFVNMEVPATYMDCEVSYRSSDNSLCTVFGNSSVCTLHPGTVPDGRDSYSCTITATLQTKGGAKQAEAELLVVVTKKDETKPYIGLYPNTSSTIITMNKGEKRNIAAKLYGNATDTSSAGLKWSINNGSGNFIDFASSKNYGSEVQIAANASGKTTVTVTHAEATNPLTIYVIVAGVDEPTVTLNYSELPVYIGEDTQTLAATVRNSTGEELEWTVVNDSDPSVEQDYFTFSSSGNKAFIYAEKPGTATVYCRIPSNGSVASCKVSIKETEKIEFFVYDDESKFTYTNGILTDNRTKYYLTSFQLYPGETKPLHYETVPAKDKITRWYRSDNSFFDMNTASAGYLGSWTDPVSKKTYYYPDGVGTIAVTGKTTEGTATLQVSTASSQSDSVTVMNSYNYLFATDKSIVSATPKEVHNDKTLLHVNYELRPACSKIIVTNTTPGAVGSNLKLADGTYAEYDAAQRQWTIETHTASPDTNASGIVTGTLQFEVNGEANCNISLKAVNENVVSSGSGGTAAAQTVGTQNLKIQVYYPKHTFRPAITRQVPYINQDVYPATEKSARYSKYDKATNTIFLGDGEYISGTVSVDTDSEPYSNVNIERVEFVANTSSAVKDSLSGGKSQYELVGGNMTGTGTNSHPFQLFHSKDYAVYSYKETQSGVWKNVTGGMTNMYRLTLESDRTAEVRNETVKETSYVGYLKVVYTNYAAGSGVAYYNIPVYVQVRNNPCAADGDYYKAYTN